VFGYLASYLRLDTVVFCLHLVQFVFEIRGVFLRFVEVSEGFGVSLLGGPLLLGEAVQFDRRVGRVHIDNQRAVPDRVLGVGVLDAGCQLVAVGLRYLDNLVVRFWIGELAGRFRRFVFT